MADGRLRLTIVGGFLGSGKTTWLRHQLFSGRFDRAHLIVNEAAGTPVDHALLSGAAAQTVLAGGCVCCDGARAFQDSLLSLCDARNRGGASGRIEQLVLETSGLADPAAIVGLIQSHPVLVRHIVVHEIVVVVDGLHGRTALESQPIAQAQIRAADRLILTKTDVAPAQRVAQLRHLLGTLAPGAAQSGAAFGSEAHLPAATEGAALPDPEPDAPKIVTCQIDLGPNPDWTALTLWLSALLHARGERIVRVKGVVRAPAGRLLLQAVRSQVQSPEVLPAQDAAQETDNRVVLIGSDLERDRVARSFLRMQGLG